MEILYYTDEKLAFTKGSIHTCANIISVLRRKKICYYITIIYRPCNIPPALPNNRLAIVIGGPISNITIGPGPKVLFVWPCFSAI